VSAEKNLTKFLSVCIRYKAGLTQLIKQQREIANLGQDLMLTYLNRNDKLEERCDLFDNDKRFTLEEV